jgi:hypothetical protein
MQLSQLNVSEGLPVVAKSEHWSVHWDIVNEAVLLAVDASFICRIPIAPLLGYRGIQILGTLEDQREGPLG